MWYNQTVKRMKLCFTFLHSSDFRKVSHFIHNYVLLILIVSLLAYWLRSKRWVCCQHIYLWSWMRAFWYPFHRWAMQVLCIVTAQGGGRCYTIHTVKIAVHSAEGCCTATTMPLLLLLVIMGQQMMVLYSTLFTSVF